MANPQTRERAPQAPISRSSVPVIALVFVLIFAVSQTFLALLFARGHLDWLIKATTVLAGNAIAFVGIPATVSGNQITLSNHVLEIVPDCTGISLAALYASLVVAYPLSWRTRLVALAVGMPVIAVANLLRLLAVALASEYLSAQAFDFAHDYLFMGTMVLLVVALWVAWLQMAKTRASRS